MKRQNIFLIIICSLLGMNSLTSNAQTVADHPYVKEMNIEMQYNEVILNMEFDFSTLELKKNQQFIFTPVLVQGDQIYPFPTVEVLGRKANLYQQRNPAYEESTYKTTKRSSNYPLVSYSEKIPYEPWMNHAQLMIAKDLCGCNKEYLNEENVLLTDIDLITTPFIPLYAYIEPEVEEIKNRSEKGTAFLDFKIGKTDIVPDFRNNFAELEKIKNTLRAVQSEAANTLTKITLHGYASPDGSYANNERLAKGRANALKNYIQSAYGISETHMDVTSTPEDWVGLREAISKSDFSEKEGILDIIDGSLSPDAKESRIRVTYPEVYRHMKDIIYPALRRSEYTIEYEVRAFTLEESREIFKTNPKLLSLNELYRLAVSYEAGSNEYNEVFYAAALLYPEDGIAQLNAANIAIQMKNYKLASEYLSKVSDSPEKTHALGLLYLLQGENEKGIDLIKEAADKGVKEATANLKELERRGGSID